MLGLFDSQVVRAAEQAWAREHARPTFVLMERAAAALVTAAERLFDAREPVVVLAGRGNNGGDGVLAACLLHASGWTVQLWSAGSPKPGSDAEQAWNHARSIDLPVTTNLSALSSAPERQVIDALLGTGFRGEPRGLVDQAIDWCTGVNAARVLAVDCPSGLNADTGQASRATAATQTLTFIAAKPGLFTGRGPGLTGAVVVAPLDAAPEASDTVAELLGAGDLRWPQRSAVMHKGAAGHVVVLGGGPGMPGAAALAAESALVSGAGRVSALVHPPNRPVLATRCPEILVPEATVPPLPQRGQVLVAGPGLGRNSAAAHRLAMALNRFKDKPQVLDADALWHLAETGCGPTGPAILTPHPGEAAHLLGTSVAAVESDRLGAARQLQARFGGTVVLKGAGTIVADPQTLRVVPGASGGLATSGLGDVLSGVLGALLAQGLSPAEAAQSGAFALTRAGLSIAATCPVARASRVMAQVPCTMHDMGFKSPQNPGKWSVIES